MSKITKTIEEINEKIESGSAKVVSADEMTKIVTELGAKKAAEEVDVVTTGTFGAMCSSGVWLNFGHSEPPIKMSKVWLNEVEAYAGVAAVDAYLGATRPSESLGIEYGGGHVIEDLIRGKPVCLKAVAYGTDCYPRKNLETEITINDLNQAIMSNPRNGYERYNVAVNSTDKTLYTYMGKLLPNFGNAVFSGAGALSPIINDSNFQTIGIGTRIFLGGADGYIIGNGTQHKPESGFGTLMVQGNLKDMSPEFIRGATLTRYGCTLYVGIGVPIPILNPSIALNTGINDERIITNIIDYGVASRNRPVLRKVNYAELKSGSVEINGEEVKTSPISSLVMAKRIATLLNEKIKSGKFLLSQAVQPLPKKGASNPMIQKKVGLLTKSPRRKEFTAKQFIYKDDERCINCGLCLSYCPTNVFTRNDDWEILADPSKCIQCLQCQDVCPQKAIYLQDGGRGN